MNAKHALQGLICLMVSAFQYVNHQKDLSQTVKLARLMKAIYLINKEDWLLIGHSSHKIMNLLLT